jgi:hypothetical protein
MRSRKTRRQCQGGVARSRKHNELCVGLERRIRTEHIPSTLDDGTKLESGENPPRQNQGPAETAIRAEHHDGQGHRPKSAGFHSSVALPGVPDRTSTYYRAARGGVEPREVACDKELRSRRTSPPNAVADRLITGTTAQAQGSPFAFRIENASSARVNSLGPSPTTSDKQEQAPVPRLPHVSRPLYFLRFSPLPSSLLSLFVVYPRQDNTRSNSLRPPPSRSHGRTTPSKTNDQRPLGPDPFPTDDDQNPQEKCVPALTRP